MLELLKQGIELLDRSFKRKGLRLVLLQILASLTDVISLATFFPVILLAIQSHHTIKNVSWIERVNLSNTQLGIILISFALVCIWLKTIFNVWTTRKRALFAYAIAENLASKSVSHFWKIPYGQYVKADFSSEMNRLNNLPLTYANNFIIPCGIILSEGFISMMLVAIVAVYNLTVFLLLGTILLPVVFIYKRRKKRVQATGDVVKKTYPLSLRKAMQAIEGWIEINLFNKRENFLKEYRATYTDLGKAFAEDYTAHTENSRTTELIAAICICLLSFYLFLFAESAEAGLTAIILYGAVAYRVIPSFNRILSALIQIRTHRYAIEGLRETLSDIHVQSESNHPVTFNHSIELESVTAGYDMGSGILRNVSLKISKGERILLCGKSGSGKSTLLLLLLRFIIEEKGAVLADGVRVSKSNESSFRKLFGYVPQHPYMLAGTIAENIALTVNADLVDSQKIDRLLSGLDLKQWTDSLPAGVNTIIGEKGLQISGGQRQRIAIARALYHDSEILLLDEVTNQLDIETEKEVKNTLKSKELAGKTIIMVTHRPVIWNDFDSIYYLKDGQLEKQLAEML